MILAAIAGSDGWGGSTAEMKLTADQVREIRALLSAEGVSRAEIAHHFGVSERTIAGIARRETWQQVDGPKLPAGGPRTNTGFWGVTANHARTRFNAWIRHGGRTRHLGVFRHAVNAARAYDAKARQLGLPPEKLNFPEES
jgi:hypothetical protein